MYEKIPDDAMVWFEAQTPRWKWQWWGWKKVDEKPVEMGEVRMFIMIAAAPMLMRGWRFRVRPA